MFTETLHNYIKNEQWTFSKPLFYTMLLCISEVQCCYVPVKSKPDHPPGKPPGNVFERANSPPLGHKESAKLRPLGQKNCLKPSPPGHLFSKNHQKRREWSCLEFTDTLSSSVNNPLALLTSHFIANALITFITCFIISPDHALLRR